MKKLLQILLTLQLAILMTPSLLQAEYLKNATPPAKDFDWMELQSGEWLKGEFKGMYSGDVEFDSDEFDLVTFELSDIKQIITKGDSVISLNRPMPILTALSTRLHKDDKSNTSKNSNVKNEVIGKILFREGTFKVVMQDKSTKVLNLTDIASIAGGEPKESNYWSASIFLGVDVLSGNTKQTTVTAKAHAQRRSALTRFLADYLNTYTKIDNDTKTADNNRFTSSFDMYQTAHFYWRLASLEYLRDPFRNITGKYTVAVGLGYDIIYTPKTNWSVTMGPGYQYTSYSDYNSSNPASIESADTGLFFLNTKFDTEVTSDIDFIINYNAYFLNHNSGSYTHHAEIALETELINDFTIDLSLFWDRTKDPIAFADGSYPEQDDFKTMLAIGYSY